MTDVQFRPLGSWPYPDTSPRRGRRTFKAGWQSTLDLLERELEQLGAFRVVIQADFRERDLRLDGMPRADARVPHHPGVILSFESDHGPLRYATDAHMAWQHNVRAIALGLEALRAVDRYGITQSGEQYTGWKQLTAGSGITTEEAARELIGDLSNLALGPSWWKEPSLVRRAYRASLKYAHPDGGGTTELFAAVQDAGRVLGVKETAA